MKLGENSFFHPGLYWARSERDIAMAIIEVYADNSGLLGSDDPEWDDLWAVLFQGDGVESMESFLKNYTFIERSPVRRSPRSTSPTASGGRIQAQLMASEDEEGLTADQPAV